MDDKALRLQQIFRAVFELPDGAEVLNIGQGTQPNWDSLAHVSLIVAIESEFGLELSTVDSLRVTSYESAMTLLKEKAA